VFLTRRFASARAELGQISIAFALAVVFAAMYVRAPALLALIVPTGMAAIALSFALRVLIPRDTDDETARWLRHVTGVMFVAHLLISLAINSSSQLVKTFGGDAVIYHLGGVQIVDHWNNGASITAEFVQTGKEGFFYTLAVLYWLFGTYQTAGLAVVAAFAAAVIPLVYDTTRRLFGKEAARIAALMVMLLPGFLVWTSQLLREAPIVFFLALAANAVVRLTERTTLAAYATLAASIAVLFTLRANVSLVAAGGLLVGLVVGRKGFLEGATAGAAALTLMLVVVVAGGIGYQGYALTSNASLRSISTTRQALAQSANTGIAPDTDISTSGRAISFLPIGMVNFGLGPFPWQVRNGRQLGGAVEALTLWFLWPSLWRGWRAAKRVVGFQWTALVAPALFIAVALSLLIGNYGTVVRERLQVTIFLIPLAAHGWTLRKDPGAARWTAPVRALHRGS
jgi:hypothetical protein